MARLQLLSLHFFLMLGLCAVPHCSLTGQEPLLRHTSSQIWNTSSGLPQDTIHQLLQTQDGFLWMATEGGLVRFDGYDFVTFDKRSAPQITSDLINALFADAGGHLWIATADGLIEYKSGHRGSAFQRYGTGDGLPSSAIWDIGQDHLGRIWIATSAGLACRIAGKFHAIAGSGDFDGHLQQPILSSADGTLWFVANSTATAVDPDGEIKTAHMSAPPLAMAVGPDSALWIASSHGLLRIDRHGNPSAPALPAVLAKARLLSLAWDHSATLWMGTTSGLYSSQSPAWSRPAWHRFGKTDGLAGEQASKLYVHSDSLAIVTDAGLTSYSHGHFTTSFEQEGFKGPDLRSLYQDKEGNLWLGSENSGAAILRHAPFATLTSRDGLASDPVRSVYASAGGDTLFGTTGGLSRLQNGKASSVTTAQGLASNEILALAPSGQRDSLWVGTPDGLSYLNQGRTSTLTASDGLPDDSIRSLLLASDSMLWIGTSHGLASLPQADPAQAKSIRTYTAADGLGSNVIGALLEDVDGSLWIGTLNGLSHLSQGRISTYNTGNGLRSSTVTALGRDRNGTLWIGTSGGGLFSLVNGKIASVGTSIDSITGRLPATIYAILEDDSSHLWLGSSTGVYRVAARDLQAVAHGQRTADDIPITHFDVADGLRLQDCASGGHPEAALDASGLLWFATQKGASVVDTHSPSLNASAPPIGIENITVDDVPIDDGAYPAEGAERSFKVPAGHARIAFHYAGISFSTPYKVRYRYQLDHFDRTWIDAGSRRTAYYTNIPPGHYTFRVLASIDGGDWSRTTASINFTIAPHYYQTWWFYTLLALLTGLIAWQLYLYRLRQVELRFSAVLAERGRIAREIHDTLAQDIVGISVQLELVSRLMTLSLDKAKAQLQDTRTLVRKSLAGARSSIWDLRSPSSGSSDLPTRLRDTAKQITRDTSIALRLDITGTYRTFPQVIEDELLRIAQEAVTNAVRHASPMTIKVTLSYHEAGARLEVRDDGNGFAITDQKSGPAGHYGLRGMYERAERAHATLEIKSSPGEGTTVTAEAPAN